MNANVQETAFSAAEGGQAIPGFPEAMTAEKISMLEETLALLLGALRRSAQVKAAQDAGAKEYDSWAGAMEYDSWSSNFH